MFGLAILICLAIGAENFAQSGVEQCSALAELKDSALGVPTARVISAKSNPKSEAKIDPNVPPPIAMMGATPGMPEHCEVIGTMRERRGTDGQQYAVKFRIRLPANWNGKFLFQGGGGTNGLLGNATGSGQPGLPTALDRGYAVVSTDTGHDNATNSNPARQGQIAFGHDYEARLEYSEKALDSVATTAKLIVRAYYGRAPVHSYFTGCSNGGREGMVFAQRFPEHFDGIVAGAPAFAVPKAAIAEAWDTQAFAALAKKMELVDKNGQPDIARTFSDKDFRLVSESVVKSCDADDGLADGMVQDVLNCTTARVGKELRAHACAKDQTADCLTEAQIDTLIRSIEGPRNSKSQPLYSKWPWDAGIGDMGWRVWKIGLPGAMDAINVMLGSPALSGLSVTPPATVADNREAGLQFQLEFDFDRDAPKIFGKSAEFPRSGWELVGAQTAKLDEFRRRGGKMIVPHGGSDPIFSINDTIDWWRKVDANIQGKAAEFVRVFPVPGMTHCAGGPATDQYDALTALEAWVELGKAPDRIEASAGPRSPWPGRTRPLCPYPKIARYKSGDVNRAESFVCELPKN